MKLIESCIIICLFFSIVLSVTTVETQETASTIYVDDDNTEGPWDGTTEHPFQYIQDGIDASIDGDIIFVNSGTYMENIEIVKKINIQGEN